MKTVLSVCAVFVTLACLLSGCTSIAEHPEPPNLLTNGDFSAGGANWSASNKGTVEAGGMTWHLPLEGAEWRNRWDSQLTQQIELEGGRYYQLSLTISSEGGGLLHALYLINSKLRLGLDDPIDVTPGTFRYCRVFRAETKPSEEKARLTFSLGKLKGVNTFSDIRLTELQADRLPFAVGKDWQVFVDAVAPDSYAVIPAALKKADGSSVIGQRVKATDGAIDLGALAGPFKAKRSATLYNQFRARQDGVMWIGCAADWWMEVYINGVQAYTTLTTGNGSSAYTPDDHVFSIPVRKGENVLAVRVLAGSKGWRFVCGVPKPLLRFEDGPDWGAVDLSDLAVKAGTALDLSAISAVPLAPDGRLPRLGVRKDGKLGCAEADRPIRLKGVAFGWPSDIDEYSSMLRRQGYNLVRLGSGGASDQADRQLASLGKHGVYAHVILASMMGGFNLRNDAKVRMFLGDPGLRKAWKDNVTKVMNHVNPHTGLAWKDDPTILEVEFYNEQAGGFMWGAGSVTPETFSTLDERFRSWLKEKYATPEALAKAWDSASIKTFEQVSAPRRLLQITNKNDPRNQDFVRFCNDLVNECTAWCEATLRATGYKGLSSQGNAGSWLGALRARYEHSQVSIVNRYFNHPSQFMDVGSALAPNSSIGQAADYWRSMNSARYADRPLVITEFNHSFWNPYQHEGGLVVGAYSAFQGFSGMVIHQGAVIAKGGALNNFSVGNSPVARANEFLSACLFLRGDVTPSPHRVEIGVPERRLGEFTTLSSEQNKIGLLCGMTVSFPESKKTPEGIGTPTEPDLVLRATEGADMGTSTGWSVDAKESGDKAFSLDAFVEHMREKAILGTGNASSPAKGVFQSDTGEVTMRTGENLLKVVTPHSEAVTLEAGKSEVLGQLSVEGSSVPAMVAACAMDGQPVSTSRRIVLVYSTNVANSGMELSADSTILKKKGLAPVLMETGTLTARLRNTHAATLKLYALALDGTRREELPLRHKNGALILHLDTRKLKGGPTPFFELAED